MRWTFNRCTGVSIKLLKRVYQQIYEIEINMTEDQDEGFEDDFNENELTEDEVFQKLKDLASL